MDLIKSMLIRNEGENEMNLKALFYEMIQFLVFIPAAAICYLPMKNQMKYSTFKTFGCLTGLLCIFIPLGATLSLLFEYDPNNITFPMLAIFFVFYQFTVKTDFFRCLAIFIFSCVLSSFLANFAYTFDAWLHPDGISADFSWQAGLFQFAIAVGFTLFLIIPLYHYGSKLIDTILIPSVWVSIISVSFIFLLLNIAMIPHNYSTLYVGRCFPIYIIILSVLFMLLLFMYVTLYCIAMSVHKNADLSERIRFFEMQESQYILQKRYIEETSKQRHDFRHSIFALNNLAENGDLNGLKKYLAKHIEMLPKSEIKLYFKNNAVNALLNYYAQSEEENGIHMEWDIGLPDDLTISEPDICSLFGNIIENAISGCMTLSDEKERYHYLSVTVKNDVNLYIVSTNSFDGIVRMKEKQYLSTKRRGNGIGIHSMKIIAEKYHGIAKFYHSENEFYGDIMLKIPDDNVTSIWNCT